MSFLVPLAVIVMLCAVADADLFDKFGSVIPGTEGLELVPQSQFSNLSLRNLQIRGYDSNRRVVNIEGSTFENSDLRGADIWAEVRNVNFANAMINDARIDGISEEQLKSTASFTNNDLSGIRLFVSEFNNPKSWNLSGANLQSATLQANFTDANFRGANLNGASLSGLPEAQREFDESFQGASFADATIRNATLFAGSLTMEQVSSTASYQSRDLRGVSFRAKPLLFSLLPYDLQGWDFRGQDMTHGKLQYADSAEADYSDAILLRSDLSFADLAGATFRDAQLLEADLYSTNLSATSFRNANLASTDLRSSDASKADFTGANLGNAGFMFVSNLDADSFDASSRYNQWTEFPVGFDPVVAGLSFFQSPTGDFDADENVDATDIDLISDRLLRGNDIDFLTIEEYEEGWVIIDSRYRDFVYVSNNVVEGGVLDTDPIYETYGVSGLSTFEAASEEDVEKFASLIRKGSDQNAPWLEVAFDLNGDGEVNRSDKSFLLDSVLRTGVGDSNLNGEFDSTDLVAVFSAGEYEDGIDGNSTWATGDWTGEGEFSSGDLVLAFAEGRFEMGPRPAATVPEPTSRSFSVLALAIVYGFRRRW